MPPENRRRRKRADDTPIDTSTWTAEERARYEREQKLKTPIAEMSLSVRVINTLEESGVILARDLMHQSYDSLMGMRNFGEKTLKEVQAALEVLGLEPPSWKAPIKLPSPKGLNRNPINIW